MAVLRRKVELGFAVGLVAGVLAGACAATTRSPAGEGEGGENAGGGAGTRAGETGGAGLGGLGGSGAGTGGVAGSGAPGAGTAGEGSGGAGMGGATSGSGTGSTGAAAGSAGSGAAGGGGTVPRAPGGYVVDGDRVLDGGGQSVRLRGVNVPNTIWDPGGGPTSARDFELIAAWGATAVRIGLNQGLWFFGEGSCSAGCYQDRVRELVGWARAEGLDVILDLHFATADGAVEPQFLPMPDAESVRFWGDVAALYRDDGRVLYELYNEPFGVDGSVWKSGGTISAAYDPDTSDEDYSTPAMISYEAVGMQALYAAVRGTGAHNVVIAGGLDWAYDLTFVPEFGIDGYNVVYATHLYPYAGKLPGDWDAAFGFLSSAPVMLTEFGPGTASGECPPDYLDQLFVYADDRGLSWFAWAWFAGIAPDDPAAACSTNMFYGELDPAQPVYAPTPFGERIRSELARTGGQP